MAFDQAILDLDLWDFRRLVHVASNGRYPRVRPSSATTPLLPPPPPPPPPQHSPPQPTPYMPIYRLDPDLYNVGLELMRLAAAIDMTPPDAFVTLLENFVITYGDIERREAAGEIWSEDMEEIVSEYHSTYALMAQPTGDDEPSFWEQLALATRGAFVVTPRRAPLTEEQRDSIWSTLEHVYVFSDAAPDPAYPWETVCSNQLAGKQCGSCRDDFTDPCALPCGHVFCFNCAADWLHQTEDCPTCRRPATLDRSAITSLIPRDSKDVTTTAQLHTTTRSYQGTLSWRHSECRMVWRSGGNDHVLDVPFTSIKDLATAADLDQDHTIDVMVRDRLFIFELTGQDAVEDIEVLKISFGAQEVR